MKDMQIIRLSVDFELACAVKNIQLMVTSLYVGYVTLTVVMLETAKLRRKITNSQRELYGIVT